jgi:hypothetical protein
MVLSKLILGPKNRGLETTSGTWDVIDLALLPEETRTFGGSWSAKRTDLQGTLENQGTFESTNSLRLEAGGIFRNGGTADVKGLSGNGTVEAKNYTHLDLAVKTNVVSGQTLSVLHVTRSRPALEQEFKGLPVPPDGAFWQTS